MVMVVAITDSETHDKPFNYLLKSTNNNDEEKLLGQKPKGSSKQKKPSKKRQRKSTAYNSIPSDEEAISDIPTEFKAAIQAKNGKDLKFVIQKEITSSDISANQGRLLIPTLQVKNMFLTEQERDSLDEYVEKGSTKKKGIHANFIQPSLIDTYVCVKMWPYANTNNYALITTWNDIVRDNKSAIKVGALLRLFAFRVEGKLWFALIPAVRHRGEGFLSEEAAGSVTTNHRCPVLGHEVEEALGTSKGKLKAASRVIEHSPVRHEVDVSGTRSSDEISCITEKSPRPVRRIRVKFGWKVFTRSIDQDVMPNAKDGLENCGASNVNVKLSCSFRKRSRKWVPFRAPFS